MTQQTNRQPGIYEIEEDVYHASPALSKSDLDLINQSPAHYKWAKANPVEPTRAMRLGSAMHRALLEPNRFQELYVRLPDDYKTSDSQKAEKWVAENAPGKLALSANEFQETGLLIESLWSNRDAAILLKGAKEQSVFWNYQQAQTGGVVPCRARIDVANTDGFLVDVKKCRDASPRGFERAMGEYRYHVQAAWYRYGWREASGEHAPRDFVFVAVEAQAPYAVGVYEVDVASMEYAGAEIAKNVNTYAHALKTNQWQGYTGQDRQFVSLPTWYQGGV